jgi:glycosyltransferase involved in cell wall biosynthesis
MIITPTQYSKKLLIEESGMDKRKFRIIPCGLRLREKLNKRKADGKVIGMVSRIEKEKGQDVLIKAFSLVVKRFSKSKLVIVGEGETESLKKLAKRLGIEKKVEFKGWMDDVYKEMESFDVFVFPSSWKLEGFGLVVIEAMMLGVPIVANDFGPIPEVTGDSAYLTDGDSQNLSKAIVRVLTEENFRRTLIRRGLIRSKQFSIEKVGKVYLDQIKWISQE